MIRSPGNRIFQPRGELLQILGLRGERRVAGGARKRSGGGVVAVRAADQRAGPRLRIAQKAEAVLAPALLLPEAQEVAAAAPGLAAEALDDLPCFE